MKTTLECRSLGENKTNYTNANVRQMRQSDVTSTANTGSHTSRTPYNDDWGHEGQGLGGRLTETSRTGKSVSHTSKRKGVSGGQVVAGVLAGASVGVLAGILLAPEKGKDLRKQVRNSATTLSNKVSKSFSSTKGKVTSWTSKSKSHTSSDYNNLTSQSSSEVNTMYNDPALGPTGGTNMQRCL
ncbi:YtxH domain-containing protein [Pontibacter pudoricolor]|uniref:YtxH domain-containing protein n=1 Tax=Pontibacter pudoricolor TaxID=2694930 RepID=UPI00139169A3|nr:YtxH domain-containing protein [Pontibacter pudoricolor]